MIDDQNVACPSDAMIHIIASRQSSVAVPISSIFQSTVGLLHCG
jgi:hypothetical protein